MAHSLRFSHLAIAALFVVTQPAFAIVTVGPDTGKDGCQFRTIQEAIDAVHYNEAHYPLFTDPYIAVAGGQQYNETLVFNNGDVNNYTDPTGYQGAYFQIYGDYDPTCQVENGSVAEIVAGSDSNSVLELTGRIHVVLNHMTMSGATNVTFGGGISFHNGSGALEISNTKITNNKANYGAGIYLNGDSPGITVYLHEGTVIDSNIAAHAGGGIRAQGEVHLLMLEKNTTISNNTANPQDGDGSGGGLQILGDQATADIASSGFTGTPAVYRNHAHLGGGVSVQSGALVRLRSYQGINTGVALNDASGVGGGIYFEGASSSGVDSRICTFGAGIDNNSAGDGSAIFGSGYNVISLGTFDGTCFPPLAPPLPSDSNGYCGPGSVCSTVRGNTASLDGGSTIRLNGDGSFLIFRTELRHNTAGHLLFSVDPFLADELHVENSALVQNHLRYELIYSTSGHARVNSSTIAGNTFDGTEAVILSPDKYIVYNSIIWQAGNTAFDFGTGASNLYADHVIFSDIQRVTQQAASFATFTYVSGSDPEFFDSSSGNYTLSARSPAIDFAGSEDFNTDVLNNPRGVDSELLRPGRYDIGAYEFQGTNPLFGVEGDALRALYLATNGDQWLRHDGWLDFTSDPCTWTGIACNADHTHVIAIALTGNLLTGQLPDLSGFAFLQRFYVDDNLLTGSIPSLATLQYLKEFSASSNFFTGPILGLDSLAQLTYFDAHNNLLTGSIASIGANQLTHFRIDSNNLTGSPPPPPPIPFSYQVGDFELCPNSLKPKNDSNWDMLVSFATTPWWSKCVIFLSGFEKP